MAIAYSLYHSPDLAWTTSEEERRRFRKILRRVFIVCLVFAFAMPYLPVPEIERGKSEQIPTRLAKLVLERKKLKLPPPVERPKAKVTKKKPKLTKPKKKKRAKPKEIKKNIETARQKAQRSGLLAFKSELETLRDHTVVRNVKKNASLRRSAARRTVSAERNIISSGATKGSGGINTSRLSRKTGGSGLANRKTAAVTSPVGRADRSARGNVSRRTGSRKASRSIEEIQLVFDRNKGAIYSIYNRALRKDSTLEGKVVLRLTITPSGKVVACELVSSELGSPILERKVVARVRLFDFGAKDVEKMVVTYPIDFLPS